MRGFVAATGLAAVLMSAQGCATSYQSEGLTGGYSEREISSGHWQILYAANAYTTYETVQAYWLFRAAELTLAKGYDGFTIVSDMQLSALGVRHGLIPAQNYINHDAFKPYLMGDIELQKAPLDPHPPRSFDARVVKDLLGPRLKTLCGSNICPHVHDYLLPPLKS